MRREDIIYSYIFTILARIIGIVEVILSVSVITKLMTEYSGEINTRGKYALLIGLNVDEFVIQVQNDTNSSVIEGCKISSPTERTVASSDFIFCACMFALAVFFTSMLLVFATLTMKRWLAVPWFIWKAICLLVQLVGYTYYHFVADKLDPIVLITGIITSAFTVMASYIVYQAVARWPQIRQRPRSVLYFEQNEEGSSPTQQTDDPHQGADDPHQGASEGSNPHQEGAEGSDPQQADESNPSEGADGESNLLKNAEASTSSQTADEGANSPQKTEKGSIFPKSILKKP